MPRPPAIRARIAPPVLALLLAAVALGYAFAVGGSSASAAAAASASAEPAFWASKRNPLNTYGAKLAWAWTTALFAASLLAHAHAHTSNTRPVRDAVLRYALATLYWLAMTRWFFGPPLFDRLFVHTGGACQLHPASTSYAACRVAGGAWAGGHDVSGHCFLLLHSGLFLAEEVLAPLLPHARSRSARAATRAVVAAALGLVAVWLLMLFATARFFHGADELLSGSLLGVAFWVCVYQLRLVDV
ncbi:hypothetical protein GGH95_004880 [Coemansia sp. RSA 1836]|nr:hypothetical protein IWW47_002400 [Coemansia sp. RSA 2052]KAJ2560149.1 hypothetical protein GGH95_004880 [Coemansia sp. RSA 1836]